jgi:hypothetical protein
MTPAKFENQVLKTVAPYLGWGGRAEFYNGTLFVTGIMPNDAKIVLRELQDQKEQVRMSQMGSYQSDYTFTYDFV